MKERKIKKLEKWLKSKPENVDDQPSYRPFRLIEYPSKRVIENSWMMRARGWKYFRDSRGRIQDNRFNRNGKRIIPTETDLSYLFDKYGRTKNGDCFVVPPNDYNIDLDNITAEFIRYCGDIPLKVFRARAFSLETYSETRLPRITYFTDNITEGKYLDVFIAPSENDLVENTFIYEGPCMYGGAVYAPVVFKPTKDTDSV